MNVYCTALEPFIVHGRSQTKHKLSTSPMVFPRCPSVRYNGNCHEMRSSNCHGAGFLWIQTIELKTYPWFHCVLKLLTQQTSGSPGRKWTRRPDNRRFVGCFAGNPVDLIVFSISWADLSAHLLSEDFIF